MTEAAAPAAAAVVPDVTDPTADAPPPIVPSTLVDDDAAERASDSESTHGVLVSAADLDAAAAAPPTNGKAPMATEDDKLGGAMSVAAVTRELAAMGFTDESLVGIVLEKHGTDLNACAATSPRPPSGRRSSTTSRRWASPTASSTR